MSIGGPVRCPACRDSPGKLCVLHRQQIRADQRGVERSIREAKGRFRAEQARQRTVSKGPAWMTGGSAQWPTWKRDGSEFTKAKMRTLDDKMMPDHYKHTEIAIIPANYMSSKQEQDRGLELKERAIRREAPGPRRDAAVMDLEIWIQQGMPTYAGGRLDPIAGTKFLPISKHDVVDTRKRGSTLSDDALLSNEASKVIQKALHNKPAKEQRRRA